MEQDAQGSQRNWSLRTTYRSLHWDSGLYRTLCLVTRIISRLTRKQVRQDEPNYPGYDVETQKYFW